MTDLNMHLMIENLIRGVRYEPIHYHAKANNKYVNPNFNSEKESYIISLDANSLYTSAICYELQYGEIKDSKREIKVKKLISTFYDKKSYTISLQMLKYCLRKGLKLKKIYQVIYAKQSHFMKSYISLNNEKRTECSIKKDKIGV